MENLIICIAGYTDTVSVYVNDYLLDVSSLLKDAKYTCSVPSGVCKIRVIKGSGMTNGRWKKKVALNWLSCLSGVPDFTLREVMLEANVSSICFCINVADTAQIIKITIALTGSGFEIVRGLDKCKNVQCENIRDAAALNRIKRVYLLPMVLLLCVVFVFLLSIAIIIVNKGKIWQFLTIIALIIMLFTLFNYLYRKSIK